MILFVWDYVSLKVNVFGVTQAQNTLSHPINIQTQL